MQESPAPVDVHRHCRLSAASRLPHPGPSSPGRILVLHACPAPRVAPRTTVPPLPTRALSIPHRLGSVAQVPPPCRRHRFAAVRALPHPFPPPLHPPLAGSAGLTS